MAKDLDALAHDELTQQLGTPGWRLSDENQPLMTGTLGEVVTESHARRTKGHTGGKIDRIETAIELEMFQIEQLWQHLGLPTI